MKKAKFVHPVKSKLNEQLAGSGFGEFGKELVRYRLPEEIVIRIKNHSSTIKLEFHEEIIRRLCVYFLKCRDVSPDKDRSRIVKEVAEEFQCSVEDCNNVMDRENENSLIKFMTASMYNVSFQRTDEKVFAGNLQLDTVIFNDIKLTAQLHKRSVNAEIISRLERSLNLEYPEKEEVERIKKLQLLLILSESFIQKKMNNFFRKR
ncbi:Arc family DNA-binding protein [Pantoea agglomerans]|uniref:Arc family DNA-binding protein n=1 Tax=Enterobacter agglomerans TaxID=549 RepID=UPI001F4EAFB4|nr:Arc family DNA-binding protein [Pantoea agglomerans]MCH9408630.1 Arc family DNA-binding protein [Pantoea agglomerans]